MVGELQGPTIIRDPSKIPTSFKEAPALAELVKSGALPPVNERVPAEPLVIQPLESIGTYGGTWRRGFTGPGDDENGNRIASTDKILFWDYTGQQIMPSVAKVGRNSRDIVFSSLAPERPARYYVVSFPAHTSHPTTHAALEAAAQVTLGSQQPSQPGRGGGEHLGPR